jgi:hypothetical protein
MKRRGLQRGIFVKAGIQPGFNRCKVRAMSRL